MNLQYKYSIIEIAHDFISIHRVELAILTILFMRVCARVSVYIL